MKNDLLSDGERMLVESYRHRLEGAEADLTRIRAEKKHLFQLMDRMLPGANQYVEKTLRQDIQILEILDKYLPADPPEKEKTHAARRDRVPDR